MGEDRCGGTRRMMLLTMLKAKLHRATVTRCELDYVGSISIDRDLMDLAGILPHEQVDVLNITNGERLTTYAIEAPRGSREFGINGGAARKAQVGDKIIVCAYVQMPAEEARNYAPTVVQLTEDNALAPTA
jgi:aspartate 1-decarboxylase